MKRLLFLALSAALALRGFASSAPDTGPAANTQASTANPVPSPQVTPDCGCDEPVDPVVLSSGKLYYPKLDIHIPGLGRFYEMDLRFFRGYSSRDNTVGVLGRGWV